ncbi:secreted frizzled-related protein 1b isoform 2-T2 [Clarias gariepinus]|uniref:secreted frizzled-related protein 1b isoform X2 n=1 Tax=Clarias gariepinus TaxID=13013 RepID=UPI00234DC3FD|nr:secreted frizzled-related protein 1b isoform X2 [Clarias gariepinus]
MQPVLARAMREMFLLTSLALLGCVPLTGSSAHVDSIWSTRGYGQTRCMDIPEDLRLCHGISYKQMQLPNLLDHENMMEVKQQASSWVPLVHKMCHPGTQVFLCSLFAPVCLEQLISPCKQLCESVRDACSPIMQVVGYVWPEMLNCSKFPPEEKDLCIYMEKNQTSTPEESGHTRACPQCDIKMNADDILDNMCASEFAIRAKIKKTKIIAEDKKVILHKEKKAVLKGVLNIQKGKKLMLNLKNGANCPCQQLDNIKNPYLIMGRKIGKLYLLISIYHWDEENEEFNKFLNRTNTHKCFTHGTGF